MNPRKSIEELKLANSKNLGRALRRSAGAAPPGFGATAAERLRRRLREHWKLEVGEDEAERFARALEAFARDPGDAAAEKLVGDLWATLRANTFERFMGDGATLGADAEMARFARGCFDGEGGE